MNERHAPAIQTTIPLWKTNCKLFMHCIGQFMNYPTLGESANLRTALHSTATPILTPVR